MRSYFALAGLLLIAASRDGRAQPAPAPAGDARDEPTSEMRGAAQPVTPAGEVPTVAVTGTLEPVATFSGAMPTGVAVSRTGRIFVNYPRWGDEVEYTVAELRDGRAVPYPDLETSGTVEEGDVREQLVSVQSVVIDPSDRLWVLDTGRVEMGPVIPGAAKLVEIDLETDEIVRTIVFPESIALSTTYLNDVRFDLTRGPEGTAYITDSSDDGPNAIIVVDLATGEATRRLADHPSVKAAPGFVAIVEGRPLITGAEEGEPPRSIAMGADGIAISPDGETLYYSPLASRRLYAVPTDALADPYVPEDALGELVQDLGDKGASDGLESDAQGNVYVTLYEQQALARRLPDGMLEPLVADPRLLWPDTLSLGADGYLYVTANQLHRQARYQGGEDRRVRPYALFRVRVEGTPIEQDRPQPGRVR